MRYTSQYLLLILYVSSTNLGGITGMLSYLILFGSAFLAATVLPLSSEATLVFMLNQGKPAWSLWLIATVGNTLGSVINWWLGLYINRFEQHRWFPISPKQRLKAQPWFQRYGIWSLLFAWLPIIGDALTLLAGTMRVRLLTFIALVVIGKGARYAIIILLAIPTLSHFNQG